MEDLSVPPVRRSPGATDSPREELLSPSPATLWDDGSIRELDSSRGKRRLSACCLVEVETDGVLLLIKSPMRERDWSRFDSELTVEELPVCPPDAGLACCSLLEMRERRSELRVWESGRTVSREPAGVESLGVLLPIRPPILDLASLGLVRLTLSVGAGPCACPGPPRGVAPTAPAMPDCAAVGADGIVVAGTPDGVPMDVFDLSDMSDLSDLVVIGLPIREVISELIVLRPMFCVLRESDPGELGRAEDGG